MPESKESTRLRLLAHIKKQRLFLDEQRRLLEEGGDTMLGLERDLGLGRRRRRQWSDLDPIALDPFYSNEPGRFQQEVAWSHLRGALNPGKAMAVKGLASLVGLGAGIPGTGALSFLKPSYTDPTAIEIGRLTDIIREEPHLRTNIEQLMDRAYSLRPMNPSLPPEQAMVEADVVQGMAIDPGLAAAVPGGVIEKGLPSEDAPPSPQLNATLDKIYNEYPLLRDFNIKVIDSRDQPTFDQRKMEFYNPTEAGRSERAAPFFGTPTIELFEGMRDHELYRPLIGDMLHHARARIPRWDDLSEEFKASMTDEQIERELEVWSHWTEEGKETRSFADYLDASGIDQLVHGHPDMPSAMPEDGVSLEGKRKFYTPEQGEIVRQMKGLLSNEDTLLLPPVRPEDQGIIDLMKGLVSQDAPPEKRLPPQLTLDEVRDKIVASGGDRTPYVPEPSKTWSFETPALDPFAEPLSSGEFQRQRALSDVNAIIHPKMAAAVKRGAGAMLGLGPLGKTAIGLLPKPRFTDPEALYLQSITDAAEKDLRWMGGRHHEAAPPLASEIEASRNLVNITGGLDMTHNAQAARAAAEQDAAEQAQATMLALAQSYAPTGQVSGVDIDPGQAAPSFDLEAALAIAGITPESWGG